jgi:hypothetical protein
LIVEKGYQQGALGRPACFWPVTKQYCQYSCNPVVDAMRINADFSKQAVVDRSTADWISSPEFGVDRIMLDRIGDEVARVLRQESARQRSRAIQQGRLPNSRQAAAIRPGGFDAGRY